MNRARIVRFVMIAFVCSAAMACSGARSEGLDAAALPVDIRPSYELFAQRCSKCHSLSRPLESGITDDAFWAKYVERMRRQPSSGIAPSDVPTILHFLHYYSESARNERGRK